MDTSRPLPFERRDVEPVSPDTRFSGRFADRTLLITGGARGICRATAIRAAREGGRVVVADLIVANGEDVVSQIRAEGGSATYVQVDVRRDEDCERMVEHAVSHFGGLDLVVNGAGVMDGVSPEEPVDVARQRSLLFAPIHEATDEYWNRVMDVNAGGIFRSMRHELRQLLRQGHGGAIVNIGSIAGLIGLAGNPAYVASKHAVTGLTRNAAVDYAPYGIRINSVNMSGTETPMTSAALEKVMYLEKEKASQTENRPRVPDTAFAKSMSLLALCDSRNRMATPWEQASIILFLLSEDASNVTGATWATDGGWTTY